MDPREGGGCQPTAASKLWPTPSNESLGHRDLPLPRHLRRVRLNCCSPRPPSPGRCSFHIGRGPMARHIMTIG
jgi:hypothetical protein